MKLIIDADPIVYRAGFASETHGYHVVAEDADGNVCEAYFAPKFDKRGRKTTAGAQMKAWLKDKTLLSKEQVVHPEPKEHALHLVKQEITSIISAVAERLQLPADLMTVVIVLSGPDNFREKLATLRPYKGNRDAAHKPYWYQAIRDYITGHWSGIVVSGREADDEVSILGHECLAKHEMCCVATIDKDLDQVPGLHYDYRQKVFYSMTRRSAELAFWRQALSGDQTDNIPGCYKIGSERSDKIIKEILDKRLTIGWPTPAEFWGSRLYEYEKSKLRKGCPYADLDTAAVATENARLVYMQQKPRELWVQPGDPAQWLGEGDD
jgi:hypothetical protein